MPRVRRRLDRELVARGLAADAGVASRLIEDHRVLVEGAPALKASTLVTAASSIHVRRRGRRFVSRAGEKLWVALAELGVGVTSKRCLDVGAGQGGFTDCLLQAGAREVVAVDVGYGDFDWRLRNDAAVRLLERTNIRTLDLSLLGAPFDLVVADLSFISLTLVADRLVEGAASRGDLVLLVKPQFEAPRPQVGPGGIVRDPAVWRRSLESVARALGERGLATVGVAPSRLPGARGNREFFVWARRDARRDAPGEDQELIGRAIARVVDE